MCVFAVRNEIMLHCSFVVWRTERIIVPCRIVPPDDEMVQAPWAA